LACRGGFSSGGGGGADWQQHRLYRLAFLTGGKVVGGFVLDCSGGCLLDSGSSGISFLV